MRLYRNDDMTAAVQWAATQGEANQAFGRGRWSLIDVPTDKPGLLAWLNANAFAPDAAQTPVVVPAQAVQEREARPSYAETSLGLDDAWEALPLPRKLHFAGLALEDARAAL